jgi:hypothetical protein
MGCGYCSNPDCRGCRLPSGRQQLHVILRLPKPFVIGITWKISMLKFMISDHISYANLHYKDEQHKVSLTDCLNQFSMSEEIEFKCEKCDRNTTHTNRMEIWRLPEVLAVHLKRFQFECGSM